MRHFALDPRASRPRVVGGGELADRFRAPTLPGDCGPLVCEDDDRQLSCMMTEIGRALHADGVMVTWHSDRRQMGFMLASSDCADADLSEMLSLASDNINPSFDKSRCWNGAHESEQGSSVLTTKISTPDGHVTILSLFRHLEQGARSRSNRTLARLLPLIEPFVRLWVANRSLAARVLALTAVVDKTDLSVILVDQSGRIEFANPAAKSVLAQRDGVCSSGGRLTGTSFNDTLMLQAILDDANASGRGIAKSAKPVVAIQRRARRPLLASAVACTTRETKPGNGMTIVYLIDPEQEVGSLLEPTCRMYGLSPIETKLTCLIADGKSLAAAAIVLKVREMTARSYLKQIFQKTDTNRQGELVWLMLKSAVRIAPETFPVEHFAIPSQAGVKRAFMVGGSGG